jgi:hypothetical protein
MIEIEQGIPIPNPSRANRRDKVSVFRRMEVGDSVFVAVKQDRVYARFNRIVKETGAKFTTRKAEKDGVNGTRVWRVK